MRAGHLDPAPADSCNHFCNPTTEYWAGLEGISRSGARPQAEQDQSFRDESSLPSTGTSELQNRLSHIRAYVEAVRAVVANETTSISAEKLLRWSKWALAAADRIDPLRSARFIRAFEIDGDANQMWVEMWGSNNVIIIM
jgi:hypothetical protein